MFIWRLISKTNPEKKAYSACMELFNYCATAAMLACFRWTRQVFVVPLINIRGHHWGTAQARNSPRSLLDYSSDASDSIYSWCLSLGFAKYNNKPDWEASLLLDFCDDASKVMHSSCQSRCPYPWMRRNTCGGHNLPNISDCKCQSWPLFPIAVILSAQEMLHVLVVFPQL